MADAPPPVHLHFTPTSSSWLNLVEGWFAELTTRKLRRSAQRSITELEAGVRKWVNEWNGDPTLRLDQDQFLEVGRPVVGRVPDRCELG